MRKFKVAVAVLITVTILIAGAYIPKLVARFLDWQNTGKSTLNPIASIELNIHKELSPIGKLVMMGSLESLLPIRESKAGMTSEEVMDAVIKGLTPYMDTQLVVFYDERVDMQPYLVQVPGIPELQRVVWQVTVSGNDSDFNFFDLLIDDETGKILRINYTAENPQIPYGRDETLNLFMEIFFSSLGIDNFGEYLVEDLEYAYTGDNAIAVRFRFEDEQYGGVNVDMFVHENGFYIEFPNT